MRNYIKEYFTNPKNVMDKKIYCLETNEQYTPEAFFELGEDEQKNTHIIFNHIVCKDGFKMSVQASYGHYCNPRITLYSKHNFIYEAMEVGFPSEEVKELMPYACQETYDGVYAGVPVDLLNKIIEEHGGI